MSVLGFGVPMPVMPSEFWPPMQVGETAVFIYDATADITVNGVVDGIVSASIKTMPSGAGELAPTKLVVTTTSGTTTISATLTGGVSGRTYVHQITFTTVSGMTLPVLIGQVCSSILFVPPYVPPPSPGFGTPVSWP